jgi:hypothetical protein
MMCNDSRTDDDDNNAKEMWDFDFDWIEGSEPKEERKREIGWRELQPILVSGDII